MESKVLRFNTEMQQYGCASECNIIDVNMSNTNESDPSVVRNVDVSRTHEQRVLRPRPRYTVVQNRSVDTSGDVSNFRRLRSHRNAQTQVPPCQPPILPIRPASTEAEPARPPMSSHTAKRRLLKKNGN